MNEFISKFSGYSNAELLKIIQNLENYQPLAIEAAKINIENRNLSQDEIEIANIEIEQEKVELELTKAKTKAFENKAQNVLNSIVDTIHPIQKSPSTTDKTIRVFCYVFGIAYFVMVYNELGMIRFMITDSAAKWDFSMALYFLPFAVIPIATILFYLKKKLGWTLFAIYLAYNSLSSIYAFLRMLQIQQSGFSTPSWLLPTVSVGTIFFFVGGLFFICKANIREIYSISTKTMLNTIGLIAVITALSMFGLFKY